MEALEYIALGAILLILLAFPAYIIFSFLRWVFEKIAGPERRFFRSRSSARTESGGKVTYYRAEDILLNNSKFYAKLSEGDKAKFIKRLFIFISEKDFKVKSGLILTDHMIVLIAASAVQLTFGLRSFTLSNFNTIIIYPREFYSRNRKQLHKGETNLGGVIVLSWKHFEEGNKNEKDGINLGLHEMAHALRFNEHKNDDYDVFFSKYIDKFQVIANEELTKLKAGENSFLRSYAATNFNEFFAVCVEYFFESPNELQKQLPDIYYHLSVLLNQDPVKNITNKRLNELPESEEIGQLISEYKPPKISLKPGRFIQIVLFVATVVLLKLWNSDAGFSIVYELIPFALILAGASLFQFSGRYTTICVHTNGIRILSGIVIKGEVFCPYRKLVKVSFSKVEGSNFGKLKINYIKTNKIKRSYFSFDATKEDLTAIEKNLKEKKVPTEFFLNNI